MRFRRRSCSGLQLFENVSIGFWALTLVRSGKVHIGVPKGRLVLRIKAKLWLLAICLMSIGGCGGRQFTKKFLKPLGDFLYKLIILKFFREILGFSYSQIIIFFVVGFVLIGLVYVVQGLMKKDWKDLAVTGTGIVVFSVLGFWWADQIEENDLEFSPGDGVSEAIAGTPIPESDQREKEILSQYENLENGTRPRGIWSFDQQEDLLRTMKVSLNDETNPATRAHIYREIISSYIETDSPESLRIYVKMVSDDPLVTEQEVNIPGLDWSVGNGETE